MALDDLDSADPQQIRLFQPQAPVLELVRKGRRNISLFDAVRFWAYRARKTTYDEWLRAVEIRTLAENRRFPEPLTERHARSTAYSIAGVDLDDVPRRLRSRLDDGAAASGWREQGAAGAVRQPRSGMLRLPGAGKPGSPCDRLAGQSA